MLPATGAAVRCVSTVRCGEIGLVQCSNNDNLPGLIWHAAVARPSMMAPDGYTVGNVCTAAKSGQSMLFYPMDLHTE